MSYLRERLKRLEQTVEWLEVKLRRLEDGGDDLVVRPGISSWDLEAIKGVMKEALADARRFTDAELRAVMSAAVRLDVGRPSWDWSQTDVDVCRRAAEEVAP